MKGIWLIIKSVGKFIQGTGTFFLGLFVLMVLMISLAGSQPTSEIKVPAGGVLLINPYGNIVELGQTPTAEDVVLSEFSDLPAETSIHDILRAIRTAKSDKRIAAIALLTDSMGGAGAAHLHDIVAALQDFKTSEKPIYAISTAYSQGSYLLASQADTIYMNKAGSALLQGYNVDVMYYKGMLDKLGVTMNIFHVGDYKSAIEPFERTAMSDEAREAYEHLLGGLWQDYITTISQARGIDAKTLQHQLDTMPEVLKEVSGNFAALAEKMKLVDKLSDRQDWRQALREKYGRSGDSFKQINMNDYLTATDGKGRSSDNEIPVIIAQGEIVMGSGPVTVTAAETIVRKIRSVRTLDETKAIVLRVNSPGGSAFASELIRQELVAAQNDGIPVVVSMGPVAASGGYWISATADEIWAAPTTITGSIGIFGLIPTFENAADKIGISGSSVGTTKLAGGMSMDRPLSEPIKSIIDQSIKNGYDEFITLVSGGRNIEKADVNKIAQGRVWTGRQALENGLVDNLGTLEDAIAAAAKRADIKDYHSYIVRKAMDPFEKLLFDLLNGTASTDQPIQTANPAKEIMTKLRQELSVLSKLNDPNGRYVICADCAVK